MLGRTFISLYSACSSDARPISSDEAILLPAELLSGSSHLLSVPSQILYKKRVRRSLVNSFSWSFSDCQVKRSSGVTAHPLGRACSDARFPFVDTALPILRNAIALCRLRLCQAFSVEKVGKDPSDSFCSVFSFHENIRIIISEYAYV